MVSIVLDLLYSTVLSYNYNGDYDDNKWDK